jgi:hypothetical protein
VGVEYLSDKLESAPVFENALVFLRKDHSFMNMLAHTRLHIDAD